MSIPSSNKLHCHCFKIIKRLLHAQIFRDKDKIVPENKRENHTVIYMLSDWLSATSSPPLFPELGDHWNGAGLCTEVEEEPEHPSLSQILLRKPRIELNFLSVLL